MKKLSGMLKVVVIAAFALSSVLVLSSLTAQSDKDRPVDGNFVLKIDKKQKLKYGKDHFEKTLATNSKQYCMRHHKDENDTAGTPIEKDCRKVAQTSAEVTNSAEYTLICAGAHVTQQCAFETVAQLVKVLEEFN